MFENTSSIVSRVTLLPSISILTTSCVLVSMYPASSIYHFSTSTQPCPSLFCSALPIHLDPPRFHLLVSMYKPCPSFCSPLSTYLSTHPLHFHLLVSMYKPCPSLCSLLYTHLSTHPPIQSSTSLPFSRMYKPCPSFHSPLSSPTHSLSTLPHHSAPSLSSAGQCVTPI